MARLERVPWEDGTGIEEYRQVCAVRLDHLVEVREPLVLISQIQRSGGTLLSQLFDGHPECHAHPGELHIGKPRKWDWPPLDLGRPESWFATLFEKPAYKAVRDGYAKPSRPGLDHDVFPFLFLPRLQKEIFEQCIRCWEIGAERDVLDAYLTSYFNAWLDNQNLYTRPKRVVTAFAARLSSDLRNVERFFSAYPTGTLVSIVRDPRGWFASARRHRTHYHDLDTAIDLWCRSTRAAIDASERWGERVLVLTYELLVADPQGTMSAVAERVGISMHPILLTPTFNGRPIRANSSEQVKHYGVVAERAEAFRDALEPQTIARIDELAGELYQHVQRRRA
jgi:LPS sulfotransferase NodH